MLIFAVGLAVLAAIVIFIIDRSQTEDAVRRNYPVIGRFRGLFSELGEFFRQYFFAMDREEMPFNRAQREWVTRAAEGHGNTVAFGSTKSLTTPGAIIFAPTPFPALSEAQRKTRSMVFGPDCRTPFEARHFFNISGMSYGALSRVAVEALSKGAAKSGCWLNTGEGGLSPHHLSGGCDLVFQIGTAKYGVRDQDGALSDERLKAIASHEQVRMFELKLAQGAKPGKGGILPAGKVTDEIAEIRGIRAGEASISPNRHLEAADLDGLLALIERIRMVTGKPTGLKIVLGDPAFADALLSHVALRGAPPDFITVDGGDGGTGAAPMPLMDNVGLTVREAAPLMADALRRNGLKDRIRLIASGKLLTPSDVAYALACGADFVVSARGFMFSLGCIQALKCNENTCPTGITTHDPRFQRGLVPADKADKVAAYHHAVVKEVEMIAHSCGAETARDLTRDQVRLVRRNGRTEALSNIYPEAPV
ncbi:MAG: FMN-binding glutamate synthase family protein [Pseudomonadota bacterium]